MRLSVLLCSSAEGNQGKTKYARVVELVDSLDSGSSVHCGRAGSSPASRTKKSTEIERFRCFFLTFCLLLLTSRYIVYTLGKQKSKQSVCFDKH